MKVKSEIRNPKSERSSKYQTGFRSFIRVRGLGLWFSLLILLLGTTAHLSAAFVYENPYELQANGDFDGDTRSDLLIVDKSTGAYRIGYQYLTGIFIWVGPRASGIANATGLGIGKLNSTSFDSLALAGPDANRVNILDATNTAGAGLPVSVFVPSLGPNLATVIDIGGPTNTTYDDLYVASVYNGVSPFRETLLRNNATSNRTVLADNPIPYLCERANPALLHTNRYPRLALFERNSGVGTDLFSIYDFASGAATNITSVTVSRSPQPFEYVTGQFIGTNAYTQFLLYPPTGWYLYNYQVTEPTSSNAFILVLTNTYILSNYVDRIFVLPGTNGNKLLVLDTNGVSATVYNFNGVTSPTIAQQMTAAPGEHFTGAGVYGNNGFVAYSAPLGQNTSARYRQWSWTGSGYSNSASGDLPRSSTYSASGNVMQFKFEPFVTNNPNLLRLNNAGDWSGLLAFSGSPGNISVSTETYLSPTQGLANPTPLALGAAHPLAAFGLANQYSNMISLFSFTPPAGDKISDVSISPAPGLYPAAIQLQFTAANLSDSIFYRIGSGGWFTWSNSAIVRLFTNATVQYYGQPTTGSAKSAVKSAAYAFTKGPSTLDSDGDGVPDYVEIAKGLDPNGGRDSDGDGYSDLEELIHAKNPLDASSVPTNYPHLDDQAVFDLNITPMPWDGFSNTVSLAKTGAVLTAYDLQGSLQTSGSIGTNTYPMARLTNITIIAEDRLVSYATELHYNILTTNTDTKVGREMIGLAAVPPLALPSVPYVYGGGNITNEANNWINAASNAFNNLPRAVLTNTLTVNETLKSLLFELEVAQLLGARGSNWWTNITLFPFRVSDTGRTNPAQSTLLSLETKTTNQPAYKLQTMFATISNLVDDSSNSGIVSLRAVVRDIYRIDSWLNNTNPAKFVSPVDEIRYFLWNGMMDTNYLAWATTSGQFSSATGGVSTILASLSIRPFTNVLLTVRPDTLGPCRILDLFGGGATFALLDSTGVPFGFPNNFQLLPGSLVQVAGYTDVTNPGCAYPAIQVTATLLDAVPIATDSDADSNLLIDTWEKKFFGGLGVANPFADSDGDGYSNLQEMLEGSDPRDFYGRPLVPAVTFGPPVLTLVLNGGQVELHFTWPASYINRFNFGVRHTDSLTSPFTDLSATGPSNVSGDEFKMTFTAPGTSQHFYYLTISLR